MACDLTQSYNLGCADSTGGAKNTFFIERANVNSVTVTLGQITAITKATGKVFRKYELELATGNAEDSLAHSRENGTNVSTQTLNFPINKMTGSVRSEIMLLSLNRLLVVVEDNNGIGWLYGKENGLTLTTAAGVTGTALSDRNGYNLTFSGMEKELAYPLDPATLASLLTAGT